MKWWQTVLVAAVPVLITALSLLWQQRSTNRFNAEAARQRGVDAKQEREHQRELAKLEHQHVEKMASDEHTRSVHQVWREERRTAHRRAMSALEARHAELLRFTVAHSMHRGHGTDKPEPVDVVHFDSEILSDVQLLGSDESAAALVGAITALDSYELNCLTLDILDKDAASEELLADIRDSGRKAKRSADEYRLSAKADIGTRA